MLVHHRVDLVVVAAENRRQRSLVEGDRGLRVTRRALEHVAYDRDSAEDRAHDCDEHVVLRRTGDGEVKAEIDFGEAAGLVNAPALNLDRVSHEVEVLVGAVERRELRDPRLDQTPSFEDGGNLADA